MFVAGAAFTAFAAGIGAAVGALIRIEKIGAQTDAAIKSTGGAANVSREGVDELAGSIEKLSGVEAESITEGQNLLLTFTNIKNEAGAGNDIFNQATEAMVDYSVAMGTDAKGAAIQLGKALNDPVKGLTALGKAGVQFTEAQKDMIKEMVAAGDVMGAQKIILKELETQFGGSAEAFGQTTAGKIAKFQNGMGDMFEGIVLGTLGVVTAVDDAGDIMAMHFGDMGDTANGLADDMGVSFDDIKYMVRDRMAETGETVDVALAGIVADWNDAKNETSVAAWEMMQGINASIHAGGVEVEREFKRIASMPTEALRDEYNNIRIAAYQSMVEYAKGVMEGQNAPQVAFDAAMQLVEDEMTEAEEVARLKGQLTTLSHALGIASAEGKVATVNAINATISLITDRLDLLTGNAETYGFNTAAAFASGLNRGYGYVVDAAGNLGGAVRGQIGIESEPPDPNSPLRGITKWGGNIVKTIAGGMMGELGQGRSAAGALASSLVPGLGTVPLARAQAGSSGGVAGGNSYNVQMVDRIEVRTVEDIGYGLKRLGDLGKLPGSKS